MTVAPDLLLLEQAICIGATARVASRLIAVRMPEAVVNARRSMARTNAKNKGSTPSQAQRTLMAWNLFMPNVPSTIWTTAMVPNVSPIRWPIGVSRKGFITQLVQVQPRPKDASLVA